MTDQVELSCAAVLFDSDGVLVDSHVESRVAWALLGDEYGFVLDEGLWSRVAGRRPEDSLAEVLSSDVLDAAVARLEDLEVEAALNTTPIHGAPELTASLVDRWAIATSAGRRLGVSRWAGAGIATPPIIVAGEDVSAGKPDPAPYLVAADRLGVDIAGCVVFEDSVAGAEAGRAAGARVVAVGDVAWPFEPAARVSTLADVSISSSAEHLTIHLR